MPALGVPQFEMVADTDQDHLVLQAGELDQPFRDQDAAGAIHVDRFGLGEVQPAKNPRLGVGRRRLVELLRQPFQAGLGIQPQALVRARG